MISYFKGEITEIEATHVTIEVQNIGYIVRVANPYQFHLNESYKIYIYYHIREDIREYFGFATKEEKEIFENLISVKGLGPKGALAILASSNKKEIIEAINNANAKFFINFPGIGQKLSQQIILDLKGKISFEDTISKNDEKINQVCLALKSLGYNQSEIKSVIKKLEITDETNLSDAIKMALRLLR